MGEGTRQIGIGPASMLGQTALGECAVGPQHARRHGNDADQAGEREELAQPESA
jgi:hypothetical protein